jgi:putative spermidine/putrescine transport system permease protein
MTLLDNFERIEPALLEAAANAGAGGWRIFTSIMLPLTLPGLNAGVLVLFALNFSAFAIPLMVGSANTNLIGMVVYKQAMQLGNLPFASAISIVMVAISATILIIYSRLMQRFFLWRLGI